MKFHYSPLYRPASFSSLPKGWAWEFVEVPNYLQTARPDLPVSSKSHGVIASLVRLTQAQLEDFQLEVVSYQDPSETPAELTKQLLENSLTPAQLDFVGDLNLLILSGKLVRDAQRDVKDLQRRNLELTLEESAAIMANHKVPDRDDSGELEGELEQAKTQLKALEDKADRDLHEFLIAYLPKIS